MVKGAGKMGKRHIYYTQANLTGFGAYTKTEIKEQLVSQMGWDEDKPFTFRSDIMGVHVEQETEE